MFPDWIGPVAAAPFVGSFLTVVIARLKSPGAILWGRSACPSCAHPLGPADLIPVLSWIGARGRCRHCGAPIGFLYPGIELAAVVVAAWSAALGSGWIVWASCALGWTLIALAVIDWRHRLLPDFLTVPLIAAGWAVAAASDAPTIVDSLIGAAAGFAFALLVRCTYWMVRRREGMGLGDVKLLAAAGAWVSWQGLPSAVLIAAVSGLALALLRHGRNGIFLDEAVPFGTYLCLGTWIVWLYGPIA